MRTRASDSTEIQRIYEARWTDKARKAYFATHPHRFADPEHMAYPIRDAQDVHNAAQLVGNGKGQQEEDQSGDHQDCPRDEPGERAA